MTLKIFLQLSAKDFCMSSHKCGGKSLKEKLSNYLLVAVLQAMLAVCRGIKMSCLGNVLWFIFGGFVSGLSWLLAGCLWCITIVGIPIGRQCFKFAGLAFFPFGKEIEYGGGAVSMIANIFWLIVTGIPMALANAVWGCVLCITIIGIPFGKQFFKFAKLALMPFGAVVK